MAQFFEFACDVCGHTVSTSGPHEFYRDVDGHHNRYGHPYPADTKAMEQGISGMNAVMYCPECGLVSDLVLVEFEQPVRATEQGSSNFDISESSLVPPPSCEHCGHPNLVLRPKSGQEMPCLVCYEGLLRVSKHCMS
jgi:hypothetical protein